MRKTSVLKLYISLKFPEKLFEKLLGKQLLEQFKQLLEKLLEKKILKASGRILGILVLKRKVILETALMNFLRVDLNSSLNNPLNTSNDPLIHP